MLTRRFIAGRQSAYFAQSADKVVGAVSDPVRFSTLLGEAHWKSVLDRLFREQEGQWLTPVELFRPYYSQCIANHFVGTLGGSTGDIEVIELGGGRGTNARHMLDYWKDHHPTLYERIQYTLVDSSPALLTLQKKSLASTFHSDRCSFRQLDLLHVAEEEASLVEPSEQTTLLLGLEVLDNLPHDKIVVKPGQDLQQTSVVDGEEVYEPLDDPLLRLIVDRVPRSFLRQTRWVPSVFCGVLDNLLVNRPASRVLVADFDWLPPPDVPRPRAALGEPLVTDMDDVDHADYIQAPNLCDILFPTDFPFLAAFLGSATVTKQSAFLSPFAHTTKSWFAGYNPMLDDFENCSVLSYSQNLSDGANNMAPESSLD